MLNQETKRKIDSARQILVGKVPDPKQQVDQITNALIYKFMDDMDKENEEVGLKAQFFIDDWKKFSWTELLNNKLSGQERLDLYTQSIANMSKNPHIPQLFRDIFKGAFLPYNDPRTLSLFLKEINEFNYDHSEDLGDAFEYLLSVLGSQGEAGQFRTPRHIIDFIVEAVDPKKNETIMDPACGTAGFLISAYKHILKTNQDQPLTPNEKSKLAKNLVGYDISPDMVRLAQVNMYLHGFLNPEIHEYDTLSSENRWEENFDVILANPPFMTPKGGIEPHAKFSIRARRAEVLFVDYIIEHLNIDGKAGVIVPEGIIFNNNNKAYINLRKKLVENYLIAVISLPQGVFLKPGGKGNVKTSVLFFDKSLTKRTKNILFVKINNDGFHLGAQRRPIDKNDLPVALEIIKKYRETLSDENFTEAEKEMAQVVAREKIAESGDYNLTGERYREAFDHLESKWPIVKLSDVIIDIKDGGTPSRKKTEYFGGDICWCVVKDIKSEIFDTTEKLTELGLENSSAKVWPIGSIIISLGATIGNVGIARVPTATKQGLSGIIVNIDKILPEFLLYILKNKKEYIQSLATGVTIKEVRPSKLKELFTFPLPPLSVQKEIVKKIEVKQKAIDSAKEVIRNLERERAYFGESLRKIEGIEWVELGEVCEIQNGLWKGKNPPFVKVKVLRNTNFIKKTGALSFDDVAEIDVEKRHFEKRELINGDIILENSGGSPTQPVGRVAYFDKNLKGFSYSNFTSRIRVLDKSICDSKYLWAILLSFYKSGKTEALQSQTSGIKNLDKKEYLKIKIPLPSLEIQQKLVAEAEEEQKIIDANKKLFEIMERKIEKVLSEI